MPRFLFTSVSVFLFLCGCGKGPESAKGPAATPQTSSGGRAVPAREVLPDGHRFRTGTGPTEGGWFEDVSVAAGLVFKHESGAVGNYFMPESTGSGAALFDFDNDGRLDVYLVQNGGPKEKSGTPHPGPLPSAEREKNAAREDARPTNTEPAREDARPNHLNRLFHQEPDGHFRDVSAGSGLDVSGYGMGVAVGDVNNDGLPDVLLTEYGRIRFFVNRGNGRFEDVTGAAGIESSRWSTAASFFDYDRDGWLDLVVVNYVDYSETIKCYDTRGAPEFCGPQGMQGTAARLFHNLGGRRNPSPRPSPLGGEREKTEDGSIKFEDVSVASGLVKRTGPALGVFCADFDGDHWPDIFMADDGMPNRLFINQRNGTFTEEAAQRGLAYNAFGSPVANMGIGFGDVDGDGLFDLFVTHVSWEQHALWKQGPAGFFQDQTAASGLGNMAQRGTGFGTVLADFDLDGALDLAFVNGRIKRSNEASASSPARGDARPTDTKMARGVLPDGHRFPTGTSPTSAEAAREDARPTSAEAARGDARPTNNGVLLGLDSFWHAYAQRNQLFANDGSGKFREISDANPAFCAKAGVGRGLACGDIDNDGDLDLLVVNAGGPAQLLRNVAPRRGHWLSIRAIDPALGGRDAYGAEVVVRAGSRQWARLVQPAYSFLVSNDPRAHFGLGTVNEIDRIEILWPDGAKEVFPGGACDRFLVVRKGTGEAAAQAKNSGTSP